MHVGTRLRITLHDDSKDFVITDVRDTEFYAVSVTDPRRSIRIALVNGNFALPDTREAAVQVVQALTGNPHLDVRILAKVDVSTAFTLADADLKRLSQSNEFWFAKIEAVFGEDVLKDKPRDVSAQEFYEVYSIIQRQGADATLISTAKNGNINAVRIALKVGANINASDEYGNTALIWAAQKGHVDIVRELIRSDANVNAVDEYGITALMVAARNGHLEVVQELILRGANMNAAANYGFTALMYALDNGHSEIADLLRVNGVRY